MQLYLRVACGMQRVAFPLSVREFLFPDAVININKHRQGAGRPDVKDDIANGKAVLRNHQLIISADPQRKRQP